MVWVHGLRWLFKLGQNGLQCFGLIRFFLMIQALHPDKGRYCLQTKILPYRIGVQIVHAGMAGKI